MDDSEKIKRLVEDYQNALCALDDLNDQYNSEEYLLGRKIWTTWWLRFIGITYDLCRSIKSKSPYGSRRPKNSPTFKNNIKYTDTLALYDYKIAVYTCITGKYDDLQEPLFKPDNVDYIMVTDGPLPSTGIWKGIDVRTIKGIPSLDDSRVSRYVKLHPHLFLNDYDYSIFIDGNIKTIGDMRYLIHLLNQYGFVSNLHRHRNCIYKELEACINLKKDDPQKMRKQIDSYRSAGMPEHYGLIEANILVRDHHNPICIEIMERWWQEIVKHSRRDQLSLPFVLWEMGIPVPEIGRICDDIYKIPSIRTQLHLKG
jgi:hypothetical protein